MHTSLEPPTIACVWLDLCVRSLRCDSRVCWSASVRRRCSASCSVTAITNSYNCTKVTEQRRINKQKYTAPPLLPAYDPDADLRCLSVAAPSV